MNRLYSLLTYRLGTVPDDDYYWKRTSPVRHTVRSRELADRLLEGVPDGRLPMFACFVCQAVQSSVFAAELSELDRENTYAPFVRDPSGTAEDPGLLVTDIAPSREVLDGLCITLDDDIRERLGFATWLDAMGAVCLQILREAY